MPEGWDVASGRRTLVRGAVPASAATEEASFVARSCERSFIMKTKQLVFDAMLAAMCAVLGYVALDLGNVKITFESLPILIGAFLFGPVDGLAVGAVGTFIYQMLRYGFSVTTVLWILPYALCGLFAGLYAKKSGYSFDRKKLAAVIFGCELLVTLLNTLTIYIDSKIFGYYYAGIILGALAARLIVWAAKAAAFSALMPYLVRIGRRITRGRQTT